MKKIICVIFSLLILCGCSGSGDKNNEEQTTVTTKKEVHFDDDSGVLMADGSGNFFLDGEPISSEEYENLKNAIIGDTASPVTEAETETAETIPSEPEDPLKNDPSLGKYVDTGSTELDIRNHDIYISSEPGIKDVKTFSPGDTVLFNIWCSDTAYFDSYIYVVSKDTPHKDSYESGEYIHKQDMFMFSPVDAGQIFGDLTLPTNITPGIYEFRFVCGTEEGYIPYYIG